MIKGWVANTHSDWFDFLSRRSHNGLLLRSDLHRLFDKGYVTVTTDLRLEVSRRLREDYSNGRSYYPLHGKDVSPPPRPAERRDEGLLRWHNDHVFLG